MKPNWYNLISRAVEEGVAIGHDKSFKHTATPADHVLMENIVEEVMNQLGEVIQWEYIH